MNIRRLQCFFSARSCSTSSLEICGTRGRASRKRLRLGVKPLISLILVICTLFSFSVSSYASSEQILNTFDMDVSCNLTAGDDTYISLDDYITRSPYQAGGLKYTSFTIPKDYYSSSYEGRIVEVCLDTSDYFTLNLDKEYNLKMYYMYSYPLVTRVFVSVDIYDNSNNLTNMILLYSKDLPVSNYWKKFDIDLNFILSKNDVPTGGYKCRFRFEFIQQFYNSYPNSNGLGDCCIFISDNIVIENLDDNSGWFQKIIDAIKSLPEKIGQFFTNLGNQIGDFFTELGNKVTELKNSIKSFFDNLTNNLKQWFKDVGNWFSELGDRIQQFFVDFYNDIIDGLKSLFIPEDGYFETKKTELETFFSEHFGIVYTAGSLSIDVLKKFTSLKPPAQAVLHVPAWQMQLPWESNKILTIVPAMDVNFSEYINSSGVLHTFYKFYRAFITVVIIFMVVNYAKRKFDYVFGKDGEGVE